MKMVQDLLSMHENVIKVIRSYIPQIQGEYKDLGTGNFLTDIMEKHEKIAWMLRAHLETSPK
jgi:starvation-inducible DNA-binding protein